MDPLGREIDRAYVRSRQDGVAQVGELLAGPEVLELIHRKKSLRAMTSNDDASRSGQCHVTDRATRSYIIALQTVMTKAENNDRQAGIRMAGPHPPADSPEFFPDD
jgi:hypothetical protein